MDYIITIEDAKKSFTNFPNTRGYPTFVKIRAIRHCLETGLRLIRHPDRKVMGWAGLATDPALYGLIDPSPWVTPVDPGPIAVYDTLDSQAEMKMKLATFTRAKNMFTSYENISSAMVRLLMANIEEKYQISNVSGLQGWNNNMTVMAILTQLEEKYGAPDGFKDPSTDLWTLPLTTTPTIQQPTTPAVRHVAAFTHSIINTRANQVKFAHQSLCNPKISKLIRVIRKGFLKGCPYISEELVLKYLNPSPATAKGCMKRPRHGIKSTTPKNTLSIQEQIDAIVPPIVIATLIPQEQHQQHNLIPDDCDESIANVFCFGVFADKNSGVVYNDMTGNFHLCRSTVACVI